MNYLTDSINLVEIPTSAYFPYYNQNGNQTVVDNTVLRGGVGDLNGKLRSLLLYFLGHTDGYYDPTSQTQRRIVSKPLAQKLIAQDNGIKSLKTVRVYLKELVSKGYLQIVKPVGFKYSHRYIVLKKWREKPDGEKLPIGQNGSAPYGDSRWVKSAHTKNKGKTLKERNKSDNSCQGGRPRHESVERTKRELELGITHPSSYDQVIHLGTTFGESRASQRRGVAEPSRLSSFSTVGDDLHPYLKEILRRQKALQGGIDRHPNGMASFS